MTETAPGGITGRRIARNILFSLGAQAWALVLTLVSIRIVVRGLGPDAYGVFVIASLALGYIGFLDLGLSAALTRSIAIYRITDPRRLESILRTALTALLGLGIVGGVALALLTPWVVDSLLHIPPGLHGDARFVLYLASVAFAINMCLVVFAAIPQGIQRLDLLSVRNVILVTLTAGGQVLAVDLGGGLRWVAVASFASNVASLAVFGWLAPRLLPRIKFWPGLDRDSLRELFGFSARRFTSQLGAQAIFQLDRVIVGAFLPIAAVTSYAVPLSITQRFVVFHGSLTNAYFPAASELHGVGDIERGRRLYLATFKLNAALMLMLVALIAGLAAPILNAWIGSEIVRDSAPILVVLSLGFGLTTLVGPSGQLSDAAGHPGWTATMITIAAAVNVGLSVFLVPRIGAVGAAWALLLQTALCGIPFMLVVQQRILGLSILQTLTQLWRPGLAAAIVVIAARLVAPWLHGIVSVLVALTVLAVVYIGATLLIGVWDRSERALALNTLRTALPKRRAMPSET